MVGACSLGRAGRGEDNEGGMMVRKGNARRHDDGQEWEMEKGGRGEEGEGGFVVGGSGKGKCRDGVVGVREYHARRFSRADPKVPLRKRYKGWSGSV